MTPNVTHRWPWVLGVITAFVVGAAGGVIVGRAVEIGPAGGAPPRPCLEVLMPDVVLTDDTVDHGCVHASGRLVVGATYRCTDGRRLHADGFRVYGFVGEPLHRGDATLAGYGRAVSTCLAR